MLFFNCSSRAQITVNNGKKFVEKETRQFFRHAVDQSNDETTKLCTDTANEVAKIWFKFNEGSSNAIRRNIKISEML